MEDDYEQPIYFDPDGECICDHDPEDHDWSGCTKCNCSAHWEE